MNIKFVGHASFIFDSGTKKVICDPWLKGKAFNDSWSLLSPPIELDFSEIDYIWFSHEHPDHFNFETLKSISLEDKARIKVLFQFQPSTRMLEAFQKFGFKEIIELKLWKWHRVDDFEILIGPAGSLDSFCAFRINKETILNLNDCSTSLAKLSRIRKLCGSIDVLFTQFSFANWVGNDQDDTDGAKRKIAQYKQQVEFLKPRFIVPFASFVYFSRTENFRMNSWINTPRNIASLFPNTVVLYNGDQFNASGAAQGNNERALQAYENDFNKIVPSSHLTEKSRSDIEQAAAKCIDLIQNNLPKIIYKKFLRVDFCVLDLHEQFSLDPASGKFYWNIVAPEQSRFHTTSQVLWFLLNFPWGAGTFYVSGLYKDLEFRNGIPRLFKWLIYLSADIFNFKQPLRFISYWWSRHKDALDLLKLKLKIV